MVADATPTENGANEAVDDGVFASTANADKQQVKAAPSGDEPEVAAQKSSPEGSASVPEPAEGKAPVEGKADLGRKAASDVPAKTVDAGGPLAPTSVATAPSTKKDKAVAVKRAPKAARSRAIGASAIGSKAADAKAAPPKSPPLKLPTTPVNKPAASKVSAKAPAPRSSAFKAGAGNEIPAMPKVAAPVSKPAEGRATEGAAAKTAPTKTITFAGLFNPFMLEDTNMDMSANFAGFQETITEAQTKAKAAFEKSTSVLGEVGEFTKGNVEAVIESGKILAEGVQGIGSDLVAEGRTAFETFSADIKELAAVKSPTDFFKVQGDLMRKNFDSAVAYSSKNSETMLKLFSDAVAPLSGRMSLAMEKARSTTF